MMAKTDATRFPIRELAQRTGVNTSTLRAWENRHGLLAPTRTPSGHRLYDEEDVRRVRRLLELTGQGLGLAEIAPLLAVPADVPAPMPATVAPAWQGYLAETQRALEDFSTERLDALYNEACALYPIELVTRNLLLPMLNILGHRWDTRASGIAEEHFFSAWLRNKLGARLHHGQSAKRGRPLILACLPDENHEIGLLLFALAALELGYRIIHLGANMPIRQIVHVAAHVHARAIVLAGRASLAPSGLDDLAWLVANTGAPVFVGSHVSSRQRDDILAAGAHPLGTDIEAGLRQMETGLATDRRARAAR